MSLSRNLVDLYVLASAVTKVGSCVIANQTAAVCLHVKTSSILNPTTIIDTPTQLSGQSQSHAEAPQANHAIAIEVPFPGFEEKQQRHQENVAPIEKAASIEKDTTSPIKPTIHNADKEAANTPEPVVIMEKSVEIQKPQVSTPIAQDIVKEVQQIVEETKRRELKESRIPTSRFGRLWNYGTLATGMGMGAINESFKRATGLSQENSGKFLNQADNDSLYFNAKYAKIRFCDVE